MISDQIPFSSELTGVDIVKFLLSRLIKDHGGIDRMTKELDYDYKLVSRLLKLFIEFGWIKQRANRTHEIMAIGKNMAIQ